MREAELSFSCLRALENIIYPCHGVSSQPPQIGPNYEYTQLIFFGNIVASVGVTVNLLSI